MSEELDLHERFRPLAEAKFAEPTPVDQLRASPAKRLALPRPSARVLAVAATVAVAGLIAGLISIGEPEADYRVGTEPGPATTTSTLPGPPLGGDQPRLVIGAVPEGMATELCRSDEFDGEVVVLCSLAIPGTAVPDGVNLAWLQGPLPAGLQEAWDAQKPEAADTALGLNAGTPTFTQVAGRQVLTYGETGRISGEPFERPDRVSSLSVLLLDGQVVQLNSEGVTTAQFADIIDGLAFTPSQLGFTIAPGALPADAAVISEGRRRPYWLGDPLDPGRSMAYPGTAEGVTFRVGDRTIDVSVLHDLDADDFVSTWAERAASKPDTTITPFTDSGPEGRIATVAFPAAQSPQSISIALPLDDQTVALVSGSGRLDGTIEAAARAISTVRQAADPESSRPAGDAPNGPVNIVDHIGITFDAASLPAGLGLVDERTTSYGFTILAFTQDGTLAMRGDGPYLRITAGYLASREADFRTHFDAGTPSLVVQGRDALLLTDDDSDPRNLDLPEQMQDLQNPWVSITWLNEQGDSIAVQGKGLTVDQLAAVAEGTTYAG